MVSIPGFRKAASALTSWAMLCKEDFLSDLLEGART
jgi:hypothetical protein